MLKLAYTCWQLPKTTQSNLSTLNSLMMVSTWYNVKQAGQPKTTCNHLNSPNIPTIWKIKRYLQPHRTVWDYVQ